MTVQLVPAYQSPQEVRQLFSEYTEMLLQGDPAFQEYLDVQKFEDELEHPEKKYGLPGGRLYLCYVFSEDAGGPETDGNCGITEGDGLPEKGKSGSGNLAGCIGLKKLDEISCEMKRLYVRPCFRGQGIGGILIRQIIKDAKEIGYRHMLLDTLPFLQSAIHMYGKYGFYEIESYNDSPMDASIYMKLDL